MTQNYVSVVFDRKKKANTNKSGKGKIEFYIRLNRECRKYLTIGECSPAERKAGLFATEAIEKQATYELKMVEFVFCVIACDEVSQATNLSTLFCQHHCHIKTML